MARTVVFLFLIVAVATISAYPQGFGRECGPNEIFTTCGSSCPGTCENPRPNACTLACRVGCECLPGFVRDQYDTCVPTQSC